MVRRYIKELIEWSVSVKENIQDMTILRPFSWPDNLICNKHHPGNSFKPFMLEYGCYIQNLHPVGNKKVLTIRV